MVNTGRSDGSAGRDDCRSAESVCCAGSGGNLDADGQVLRRHDTLAQIAGAFGISVATVHAHITAVTELLAEQAPGLLRPLRAHDPDFVLLDGTRAERDRVGDGRADYPPPAPTRSSESASARASWSSPSPRGPSTTGTCLRPGRLSSEAWHGRSPGRSSAGPASAPTA